MAADAKFFKQLKFSPLNFFKSNFSAILSGIFIGTSYIPFPPWALLFCLVPLWLDTANSSENFWSVFKKGWISQFLLSLIGFHWISYVSHEFGYMPWPVAIAVLLLFASTVHIYIALAVAISSWLKQKLQLSFSATVLCMAGLTSLGEIFWPSLFSWNFGYPLLWIHSSVAQTADTIGFLGLSFIVLLINATLTIGIQKSKEQKNKSPIIFGVVGAIIILIALNFWGESKKSYWHETDSSLKVIQIQANIGNYEKVMAEKGQGYQQAIADQYFTMTRESLKQNPNADLIIWPESAFPDYLNSDRLNGLYSSQLFKFSNEIQKPILTGAYSLKNTRSYNAVFLMGPQGTPLTEPYHKTHLLVFGEYTPLTEYFPKLAEYSPAGFGFAKGAGPQIFPFQDIKIGPQVCYESLYPEFSARLANLGADILINITNDSWFGPTSEPYQHMIMTEARAVETRRPLLRNTNTGITTAVLADGTELQRSQWFAPWSGFFEIKFKKHAELSIYSQVHEYFKYVIFMFLISVILFDRKYSREKRNKS